MISEETKTKFRNLIHLREEKDRTKLTADKAKAEFDAAQAELWDEMQEAGIEGGFKIPLGGEYGSVTFNAKETFYGRVLDEEALVEWFEDNGLIESHTKAKVSKARLNELIRERLESGEPMPDGADWTPTRYVSISMPKG